MYVRNVFMYVRMYEFGLGKIMPPKLKYARIVICIICKYCKSFYILYILQIQL